MPEWEGSELSEVSSEMLVLIKNAADAADSHGSIRLSKMRFIGQWRYAAL
ncbi:hypothetical protein RMR16_015115 [Agrobacterium sp. rho-13.3]